jgi:thymidylate synthase
MAIVTYALIYWLLSFCYDVVVSHHTCSFVLLSSGSREFLDKYGHGHRETGDLGPVYGHQWRYFGAKYVDCHTDYTGQGVDQLAEV